MKKVQFQQLHLSSKIRQPTLCLNGLLLCDEILILSAQGNQYACLHTAAAISKFSSYCLVSMSLHYTNHITLLLLH